MISRRYLLAGSACLAAPALVRAQGPKPFVIAVSGNMSGMYQDVSGPGQAVAARLAAEDFGGQVLGRRIEIVSADDQNKGDVAGLTARQWFDLDGVSAVIGGGNSTTAAAILAVAREKAKPFMIVAAGNPEFTRSLCSPISIQWAYDTYSAAASTGRYLSGQGGSWFFITADYAFGHALERDVTNVVKAAGGKVVGGVKTPLATADWSSAVLQADASKADTIGLCVAGTDLIGAAKTAGEFGLTRSRKVAALLALVNDVVPIGLEAAQGLVASESFYWDRNEASRAWAARWMAGRPGRPPNMFQAYAYTSTLHYLRAVAAVGRDDGPAIVAAMKRMPVRDALVTDVSIRADGRAMNPTYVMTVKAPDAVRKQFDVFDIAAEIPADQLYQAADPAVCKMPA